MRGPRRYWHYLKEHSDTRIRGTMPPKPGKNKGKAAAAAGAGAGAGAGEQDIDAL